MTRRITALSFVVAAAVAGCGVETSPLAGPDTLQGALAAPSEELDLASSTRRSAMFAQAVLQSDIQAQAQLADGPALFAVEKHGHLVAGALPPGLMNGQGALVDVDSSQDPWPTDPRLGLRGMDERSAAARAASSLAPILDWPASRPLVVERAAGAPYAAAFIDGRLRLNPSLLYLASAAEEQRAPEPASPAAPNPARGCSTAGGAMTLWALAALLPVLRRR